MISNHPTRSVHLRGALGLGLLSMTLTACGGGATDAHALGTEVETTFYSLLEGEEQGPGTVAVTDVREGDFADLESAGFRIDDVDPDATTPYYVDVTYANTGDVPVDLRDPSGIDEHDDLIASLTVLELGEAPVFEECPTAPDTLEPGGTAEACAIVLVPHGAHLERISYLPDTSEEFVYWDADV